MPTIFRADSLVKVRIAVVPLSFLEKKSLQTGISNSWLVYSVTKTFPNSSLIETMSCVLILRLMVLAKALEKATKVCLLR